MRRRQASNDDAEAANNNGVTILPNNISVTSAMAILRADNSIIDDEKDKEYDIGCLRHRRRYKFHNRWGGSYSSFIMIMFLVGSLNIIALHYVHVHHTSNDDINNATATSLEEQQQQIIEIPLDQGPPPKIPRRLIFTYKYNLIAPKDDDPPLNPRDPLTFNVLQTITRYQTYWDAEDVAAKKQEEGEEEEGEDEKETEKAVVSFLSDNDCLNVIEKAEPRLLPHFRNETRGDFKADICRVAELYLNGGYYFDIDIGVKEPIDLDALDIPSNPAPDAMYQLRRLNANTLIKPKQDDIVTFATVYNRQGRFFQAFTAAMPRHPVIKTSLTYMVGFYEGTLEQMMPQSIVDSHLRASRQGGIPSRTKLYGMGVGPYTMSMAHRASTDEDWQQYVMSILSENGYISDPRGQRVSTEIPARQRYARFLYEVSLQDEYIQKFDLFKDTPMQNEKVKWCNFVCFGGDKVFFFSRVPGSKGCPLYSAFADGIENN